MTVLIGIEVHDVQPQYGIRRLYLLEKWRSAGGYELHVRRASQTLIEDDKRVGDGELLTKYIGGLLEELLRLAKKDLDNEILK